MWLVIGSYLIASAVKESGLGERIAYAFMLKFVRDAKSLIISIFALTFVLSLLIPHPFPPRLPRPRRRLGYRRVRMSRWGMPYEPEGIRAIVACMDRHALQPIGNAFDFCYLDTTSYDESHQEDFCCIQIPVALQM